MDLEYTIIRSTKRRKLTIIVERDRRVVVHAPVNTSEETIRQVMESKRQWIWEKTHHSKKYCRAPDPPGKELVNGESALYLGRNYRIEIINTLSGDIEFAQRFLVPPQIADKGPESFIGWYKNRAEEKILPRVQFHAQQLGVEYAISKIDNSKYRWGSCTVKNNLNFNWRLIKAPMFVIDYIIVHELTHLIEANHTPRFWNIVSTQIPKLEKAKAWLSENGKVLEEEI